MITLELAIGAAVWLKTKSINSLISVHPDVYEAMNVFFGNNPQFGNFDNMSRWILNQLMQSSSFSIRPNRTF